MDIVDSKEVKFSSLKSGDAFTHNSALYMKMDSPTGVNGDPIFANAVNLQNGRPYTLYPDDMVQKSSARVTP